MAPTGISWALGSAAGLALAVISWFSLCWPQVPNDQVGRLIGKGGQTIRQLQELSGAHVDVSKACKTGSFMREVGTRVPFALLSVERRGPNTDLSLRWVASRSR